MCVCMYTCINILIDDEYVYTRRICVYVCIYKYTRTHTKNMYVCILIHIYICLYTHKDICIYTYVFIHEERDLCRVCTHSTHTPQSI